MKQITQTFKNSITYKLKYLLKKVILNYLFFAFWLVLFALIKWAALRHFWLSGPIAHTLVISAFLCFPLAITGMQYKYHWKGSVNLRMAIWFMSIYYIFLVPITYLYAILIF